MECDGAKPYHKEWIATLTIPSTDPSYQETKHRNPNTMRRNAPNSLPIPLPETHIHRTPSELQLERLTSLAEDDDVRMYSRLMCGMYSQMQSRWSATGGYVHPLSMKSLQSIVKTKIAQEEEVEHQVQQQAQNRYEFEHQGKSVNADDTWDFSHVNIDEDSDSFYTRSTSMMTLSVHGSKTSLQSLTCDSDDGSQDHDCMFMMDM